MKALRNLILFGGCAVALSACSGFKDHSEVEALNEAQAVGNPFTQYLVEEYRVFANTEMNEMMDYPDALHFARKGLAAASGEIVMPEPVTDWNLHPAQSEELSTARGRLINAFDVGARDIAPQQSAIAQARFDCWIEEQEEQWQTESIAKCQTQFEDAMAVLDSMIYPEPAASETMAPVVSNAIPVDVEPMKPSDAMYLVFFDFDSYLLGESGDNVLSAVADEINNQSDLKVIRIAGHTDSSGASNYNSRLASKRANNVRDALIAHGVSAELISVEAHGEDDLLVQTADNVREPANRRAQIRFE